MQNEIEVRKSTGNTAAHNKARKKGPRAMILDEERKIANKDGKETKAG